MVLNVDANCSVDRRVLRHCFLVRRRVLCTRRIHFRDIVVSAGIANMVKFCYSSKSSCNLENRFNLTDTDRIEIHLCICTPCLFRSASHPLSLCVCVLFVIRFTVVFFLFIICYKVIGARPLSIHGVVLF